MLGQQDIFMDQGNRLIMSFEMALLLKLFLFFDVEFFFISLIVVMCFWILVSCFFVFSLFSNFVGPC